VFAEEIHRLMADQRERYNSPESVATQVVNLIRRWLCRGAGPGAPSAASALGGVPQANVGSACVRRTTRLPTSASAPGDAVAQPTRACAALSARRRRPVVAEAPDAVRVSDSVANSACFVKRLSYHEFARTAKHCPDGLAIWVYVGVTGCRAGAVKVSWWTWWSRAARSNRPRGSLQCRGNAPRAMSEARD
jgi:hypothetical protein